MQRLKVIILAHEFSPSLGSECAVGWNIATRLSKYHDITVIYARNNHFNTSNYKEDVDIFLQENKIPGLTTVSISQPFFARLIAQINIKLSFSKSGIGLAPLFFLAYKIWQRRAYKEVKRLIKAEHFDLVHQLTAISFRSPGYLYKTKLPLVWGPCSGLVKIPSTFYNSLPLKSIVFEVFRRISNYLQSNCSIMVSNTLKRASVIYAVTNDDYNFFVKKSRRIVKQMLDVGTYFNFLDFAPVYRNSNKLKILWIGRFVYSKAFNLLIDSVLICPERFDEVEIIVIGDGPLMERYKMEVEQKKLGVFRWMGNLPHNDVLKLIKSSDLLVHTSIKEATSAVILEALTYGLPVICHDAFGMGIAIDETCGIKIPLVDPETSIRGFYDAMIYLIKNRELILELKKGAQKRAEELSWDSNAEKIAEDYIRIIGNNF